MDGVRSEKGEEKEKKELIQSLEKGIAVCQWIQAGAVFTEAILLTRLYFLNGESSAEQKILAGIWTQTIGQLIEAHGVTKQINNLNEISLLQAQKLTVTGDILQSLGSGLQAIGGEEVLISDGIGNMFESIIP
ncbi:DUF6944 family repetitive protein [Mesobacillus maritimus]|uniref:Uncharacterized protein n=1 Tax=Mesobacillus maritimus TaxID=1643336 RepID=A0ABS7KAU6_9BACI|nr:hypothetical protein [Mesobacillus maritimus]MBY0099377.1 hypothetical protein [Mesobacillus maritimus]